MKIHQALTFLITVVLLSPVFAQKKYTAKQIEALKSEVSQLVEANHKQSQVMVDKVFSFAELGFQEVESSKYLTGILEKQGFAIVQWTRTRDRPGF
jgi:aminobenzoyl-glutamate utilization protein B